MNDTVRALAVVALVFAAGVVALRFTVPVADGDIFFHLAYARQMIERGTLVPDHALYSWTPASNATIYCAWLAQLALHGLWQLGGFEALFALRYLLVFATAALLLHFAWRSGLRLSLPVVAIVMVSVVGAAPVAVNLKPEMLSVFFTGVCLWAYFHAKRADRNDRADAACAARCAAWRWLAVIPATMGVWVNSHGGFALIAPLLAAIFAGELINRVLGLRGALSAVNLRALAFCWALTAVAVCLTPYGVAYPRQLVADNVIASTVPAGAYAWHAASQSVLGTLGSPDMLIELGVLMALVLVALVLAALVAGTVAARHPRGGWREIDAALVLLLAAAVALYFWFLRTTYLLPVAFGFAALHWLAIDERLSSAAARSRWLAALALCVVGAIGARAIEGTLQPRSRSDYFGLGLNYEQPVDEAEFVAAHKLPRDLYNVFDSGSYLLWRLYPQHRVMVDSRAFPYYGWFADQEAFTNGTRFETFLAKYPADTAVIDLEKAPVWRRFVRAADWQPLFYGATAAVFVRRSAGADPAMPIEAAARLGALRNARTAERVFNFATHVGDYPTAWRVLAQLEGPLGASLKPATPATLAQMREYRSAHAAIVAGRHEEALPLLESALNGVVASERERTLLMLLRATAMPGRGADELARLRVGISRLIVPVAPVAPAVSVAPWVPVASATPTASVQSTASAASAAR